MHLIMEFPHMSIYYICTHMYPYKMYIYPYTSIHIFIYDFYIFMEM